MKKLIVVFSILLAVSTALVATASNTSDELTEMIGLIKFADQVYLIAVIIDFVLTITVITVTVLYIRDRRLYKYFMETTEVDNNDLMEEDEAELLDLYHKLPADQQRKIIRRMKKLLNPEEE